MVVILTGPDGSAQHLARALADELGWRLEHADLRHETNRDDAAVRVHALIARAADRREPVVVDFPDFPILDRRYRDVLRGDLRQVRFVRLTAEPANPETSDIVTLDTSQPPTSMVAAIRAEFGI